MRIAVVKVASDNFEITDNESVLRPHAGEYVLFARRIRFDDLQLFLRVQDNENMLQTTLTEICPVLLNGIYGWTWTDVVTGKPLGTVVDGVETWRPTLEDLYSLDINEINYLIAGWMEAAGQVKNPQ